MSLNEKKNVTIVGGGLVGSLAACFFAKRGWQVNLYEKRPDIRLPENQHLIEHRSINLAISERGFSALRRLDPELENRVKSMLVPMHGRMIHTLDGKLNSQAYDVFGKHINSVGRNTLIKILLDEAASYPLVSLHFCHEFAGADLDVGAATMRNTSTGECQTITADLIVGADGAYSRVRQRMMTKVRVNFSQTYIEHGYCEFTMAANSNGKYAMDPNHLHIWPRGSFMLIALPNLDQSFTCTLFMPWCQFDQIKDSSEAVAFFRTHFSDALQLMGEDNVRKEYEKNPKGSLMYIKCTPHTYKNKVVLLGDSSHAMVPFYGQGMNCGFEDVEMLDSIMLSVVRDVHQNNHLQSTVALTEDQIGRALDEYSVTRATNTDAIVDLALDNYVEMRAKVVDPSYLIRKHLEGFLHRLFPSKVIPLYTMVSFTSIPYADVIKRWNKQTQWLHWSIYIGAVAVAIGIWAMLAPAMGVSSLASLFYLTTGQY